MQKCPRCMQEFGDEFDICPHCGYIVGTQLPSRSDPAPGTAGQSGKNNRSHAILIAAVVLAVAVAVGAAVFFSIRSEKDDDASTTQITSQQTNPGTSAAHTSGTAPVAEAETQTTATRPAMTRQQAATLYADYLKACKYEDLVFNEYGDEYEYEAEAALADINDDGVPELLIRVTNKSLPGVRGYSSATLLLGMQGGKVERMAYADYGGGSGGGDYLNFKYDTQTKKHVLEYEEYARDGAWASSLILSYFDAGRFESADTQYGMDGYVKYKRTHTLRSDVFATEGWHAEDAQDVLNNNKYCVQEDGYVSSFTYDDAYISKAEYDAIAERFAEPTDRAYQLKPVTLDDPIPAD